MFHWFWGFISWGVVCIRRLYALAALVHRVLDPCRAVLVEGRNAILGRDILGFGLVGHLLDECQDGLLGGAVVPRWQWVLCVGEGLAGEGNCQQGKRDADRFHDLVMVVLLRRRCFGFAGEFASRLV